MLECGLAESNITFFTNLPVYFFLYLQERVEEDEPMPWPGTLAVVHSYLAHKTGWGNFLKNHYKLSMCLHVNHCVKG